MPRIPRTAEQRRIYYYANKEKCLASNKAYAKRNPEKTKEIQKRSVEKNKDRVKATHKKWRVNNPNKVRNQNLKKVYGICLEDFDKMFETQGNCCAICRSMQHKGKNWIIDHNHKTGAIRGILCSKCNVGIGMLEENLITFLNAIKYLGLA